MGLKLYPTGSDGKESACNAGHLGSIPGLGWAAPEKALGVQRGPQVAFPLKAGVLGRQGASALPD